MIMKNQLLNLKMIALMCLMMVLGGGECMGGEFFQDLLSWSL